MKRFHFPLILGLLLAIGAVCNLVARGHWGEVPESHLSITPIVARNGVPGEQRKLWLQQPGKGSAAANKQKLRRLRAQRDSLNQLIRTVEQQKPTSSTKKKLAKLQAERDRLANNIRQLLKGGGRQSSNKAAPSKQGTTSAQKPTSATPATIPSKKATGGKGDKIEQIISKLSDKEQRSTATNRPTTGPPRKPATAPPKKPTATPPPARSPATSSAESPTVLRWPVESRTVLLEYGERYNPQTNTVTINPGINIRTSNDGEVSSAESGSVSMVTWMPSYRTVVIVDHGGGCRTVYANLASAVVKRGSKLRRGDRIGIASKSKEGRYLHFQVWKERQRMNPMTMLR
ncbi:MAG: peptidoglycan DD-metalloendopeptidase family protein [Armatimonadetes bacterium]|nr:peptidoglycan DD-metalloendopeptidase family protein [Armatimonadota bacterium]